MNSLGIHVAHMKVTTFSNKTQRFCDQQRALGSPETAPAYDYFGQIVDTEATVLLRRHA